jgi:N-acetylmuramoyl-L-alanine amidase
LGEGSVRTRQDRQVPHGRAPGRPEPQDPRAWPKLALLLGLVLLLCGLSSPVSAQAPAEVSGLRFGIDGHRTRVVLDLDRPLTYEIGEQSEPARLIVDLEEVRWRVRASPDLRPRGLVRAHRYGLLSPGRSRLVVDMAQPFRIVGSILLPPSRDSSFHRLIVDLVPTGAERNPTSVVREQLPVPAPRPAEVAAAEPGGDTVDGHALPVPKPAPRVAAERPPVIVIDPGHGGVDPGAIAVDGAYEKDIVLEMARELRRLIERSGRYRVALTRDSDVFIRLRDRIAKARELGGQVFVSLHADSLRVAQQRGASVYTLSQTASDEEAARLASQENRADILTGPDLSQHDAAVATILIDLAQRDTSNKSIAFADLLAEELATVSPLVRKHRRFAGFAVLKSPDMPSVLLELGYLSNPDDARNLAQPDYRAKLAQAVVRTLDRYFAAPRS